MRTSAVTQPMANATITAVETREKLGVPSDSLKTPRQKLDMVVAQAFNLCSVWCRRAVQVRPFSLVCRSANLASARPEAEKEHRLKACATE